MEEWPHERILSGQRKIFLYRWHSGASDYFIWNCHQHAFVIAGSMSRPRLLPEKSFPGYAYLPGKHPHPIRDPLGHSYQSDPVTVVTVEESLTSNVFRWGIDLFNHGYYWEAHEAWEPLWHAAKQSAQHRLFFKGLILLAAAGVKIREGKRVAAARHAARAAALFRQVALLQSRLFEAAIGMTPAALAVEAEAATTLPVVLREPMPGLPEPVFNFILAPKSGDGR
ncbi:MULTISPECIES: DUF309 domain-containing protein [unclassified Mesorhizobium]|uniref:DUF309 domain-containing protein n=1 Tax=unclassified Mesorhizobium TaxID=325217 RepID=UPI001FD9057B|nr:MULTISPECIES: DUF309 domain-containing protein [unclassified Mesorhizobium]